MGCSNPPSYCFSDIFSRLSSRIQVRAGFTTAALATLQMVEEMGSLRSTGFVDPGWEHGIAQDERKKKVRCNYCAKIVSGGIYRLKQHLARVSGEVTYCDKAPEEMFV